MEQQKRARREWRKTGVAPGLTPGVEAVLSPSAISQEAVPAGEREDEAAGTAAPAMH